ncbi:unnamed protein product [Caenorhabditis sp. 36 PRJEB53466]|nr:unnamed protein product [Caenorhabditis sp. 36 PRJEB53466]
MLKNLSAMSGFSNEVYLGIYCLVILLELACATVNGIIIAFFAKVPGLYKNKHLKLVYFLSIGDFLTAVCEAPYIIYMICNWNPTLLDFDPLVILISSIPLPMQLKVSATITVAIALNRNIAIFFPAAFRRIEHGLYSNIVLAVALSLAFFDAFLWFLLSPPTRMPNCATSGCFILGFIVIVLSISIFFKIKAVQTRSGSVGAQQNHSKFMQANRTSTGILISSLFFLTIPSVCVGVVELLGFSIFRLFGPFYSASLLSSGICNGIIFIGCNGDARRLMRKKSRVHSSSQGAPISVVQSVWSKS